MQPHITVAYLYVDNRDNIGTGLSVPLNMRFCVLFIDLRIFVRFPFAGTVLLVRDTVYRVPCTVQQNLYGIVVFRLRARWRP